MSVIRFLDTNVLLYAVSNAPEEEAKAQRARDLLEENDWALSVQVLQEFYVQATRVSRPDRISHVQATALIESWLRFQVQEITVSVLQAALVVKERHGLSYWDSAILAAARVAGCREVWSEDLAGGHDYDGIRVLNPFSG
jgi:predicted nucleic acid-binding protein